MATLTVLHDRAGQDPLQLEVSSGERLLDRLLASGVAVGHDCEGRLACASCVVVVAHGRDSLGPIADAEQDLLETSAVETEHARLACQAITSDDDIVIEIPRADLPAKRAVLSDGRGITVTPEASRHLHAQLGDGERATIRILVEPSGCTGLRYRLAPAGAHRTDDVVLAAGDLRVVVSASSVELVEGATLDVERQGLQARLRVRNPRASSTCGCGESFGWP